MEENAVVVHLCRVGVLARSEGQVASPSRGGDDYRIHQDEQGGEESRGAPSHGTGA